jgi:hypothetical protein
MARLEMEVQLRLALQTIPVSAHGPDPCNLLNVKQTHNFQCPGGFFDNFDQYLLCTRR